MIWDLVYVSGIIYFASAVGFLFFDTGNTVRVVPAKCRSHAVLDQCYEDLGIANLLVRRPMTIAQKQQRLTEHISSIKTTRPTLKNNEVYLKDADIIENKSVSALAVLYISCDNSVFKCSLKRDGIGLVTDHVQHVCDTQNKIVNLCVINSTLFIATSDLVFSYSLEGGFLEGTDFRARALCVYKDDLLFKDSD